MQRRGILKAGFFGSVVLAVGGAALSLRPSNNGVAFEQPLLSLSPTAFYALVQVAARVMRGTASTPVTIAHRVDAAVSRLPKQAQRDLDTALVLLDNAVSGLFFAGTPNTFSSLSGDAQDAFLKSWRDSRIAVLRGAYNSLRKLCLAAHYATPDAFADSAYPGPSFLKPAAAPLAARAPITAGPRAPDEGMP
jgi:hypothetical protein